MTLTIKEQILSIIKEVPGSTPAQISEFFNDKSPSNISAQLSLMLRNGGIRREPVEGKSQFRYFFDPDAPPLEVSKKPKLKKPTAAGLEARLEAAQKEIAELRQWKARAIERFPDLAVSEVVVRARKIVSAKLSKSGDTTQAEAILSGKRDTSLVMQAVISALEGDV